MFNFLFQKFLNIYIFGGKLTSKRLSNLLKCSYSQLFSHNCKLDHYPIRLIVDPGNICQLKCPLCPTGQDDDSRPKKFLKFEDFKTIFDEVKDYIFEIDLYNWGEPFLNPDIFSIIKYAQDSNVSVHINSNLNTLRKEDCTKIIESGLERLTLSIDGISQETYSSYRVGGDLNVVLSNLKALADEKKRLKSKFPRITWQFLVMKQNEPEVKKAKKFALKAGADRIHFRPVRCDMGNEIFLPDTKKIESVETVLPTNEKFKRYNTRTKKRKTTVNSCLFLRTTMVINADGSVSPCCAVYDKKWDFGNALEEGIKNAWNNEKYIKARNIISKKDFFEKEVICSYCAKNGFLEY